MVFLLLQAAPFKQTVIYSERGLVFLKRGLLLQRVSSGKCIFLSKTPSMDSYPGRRNLIS